MLTKLQSANRLLAPTIAADLLASIVVFLVALPLCMGIAIASGFPPAAGIMTGIIGGVLVSLVGGSVFQVSGPAAGLVVVIADLIHSRGLEQLGLIILLAGLMQLIGGFVGLARWFRAVPPSVITGMLSGIGILICASQFHIMVDDTPKESGIQNILFIPQAIWKGITPDASKSHEEAAIIGLVTITVLILWNRFVGKRVKAVPGALVAVIVAASGATLLNAPVHYVQLPQNLAQDIHWLSPSSLGLLLDRGVLLAAAGIAVVASAETLLTASALDKMHSGRPTDFGRELRAQGLGNILCGVVGALPMTGVMVRSGVNLNAGAKTKLSAVLHGIWLLVVVAFFPQIVNKIPTSCLAALLVYTGFHLVDLKATKQLARFGKGEVMIFWVTAVSIVCIDLLTGVTIGVALAILRLVRAMSFLDVVIEDNPKENRVHLRLKGAATFVSLPQLQTTLDNVRSDCELHIHLEHLDYIDHACLELVMARDKKQQQGGGSLVIDWSALGAVFFERRKTRRDKIKQFRSKEIVKSVAPSAHEAPSAH